jgi:hypothetical protein
MNGHVGALAQLPAPVRTLLEDLCLANREPGHRPRLRPERADLARAWLSRILVDTVMLRLHVELLQECYGTRFRTPEPRRFRMEGEQATQTPVAPGFRHSQLLPAEQARAIAEHGPDTALEGKPILTDEELAALLLNPLALWDLADLIMVLLPEYWLPRFDEVGRLLMEQHGLEVAIPGEPREPGEALAGMRMAPTGKSVTHGTPPSGCASPTEERQEEPAMPADYTIYAVKLIQPWEPGADYWIPHLVAEVRAGRARFGWGNQDGFDLIEIRRRIAAGGRQTLEPEVANAWSYAWFLLDVKVGDYFVYVNLPKWGEVTIVRIAGADSLSPYSFSGVWDRDKQGDFRHVLPCEFVASIDRNDLRVPPLLGRRMKLQGASYRTRAREQFEELLRALAEDDKGKTARQRLAADLDAQLGQVAASMQQHFPAKNLEPLVREVLERLPGVTSVRKGPDTNGADLEMDFESGLAVSGLGRNELCAVQVKSYQGTMDYDRAIEDLRKAFASSRPYTCGLIVSTAVELTPAFEQKLEELRSATGKPVGVLFGRDLAQLLVGGLRAVK